ncbi:MAG: DUF1207 domain-containing protein [Chlamydiia bacterium]|nr:DUF1207 domain-containing protein [Chlamydiia bacterium]
MWKRWLLLICGLPLLTCLGDETDCRCNGSWLPEVPPLFRPFAADPRQVTSSVAWRFDDEPIAENVIPVSYADQIAIYRWYNVGPRCGCVQLGLEGALWAVFDPIEYSSPLINADYFIGGTLSYAEECWAIRLRAFHISSHIGDEFLLDNPNFDRRNPSAEYVDLFIDRTFWNFLRLYAGVGAIVHQDNSHKRGRFYAEYGAELRTWNFLNFCSSCNSLYGVPFAAVHFRHRDDFEGKLDFTLAAGYEIGKTCGLERRLRLFYEYHTGYALEGQFDRHKTDFMSVRLTYGF